MPQIYDERFAHRYGYYAIEREAERWASSGEKHSHEGGTP